ncbi:MAG: restriction endonuclease [Anaerolineae bacterium]|nr:restriction endonuclease [Anaerolineae bacterium]
MERKLVQRNGNVYQITPPGLAYIDQVRSHIKPSGNDIASQSLAEVRHLLTKQDQEVRQQIKTALQKIDPYNFEYLIKHLLEAMGYENVEVTSKSGDGGVDVVADIEVGITSVREVVQVKRHQGNIQRPILDMLRGSLHRFNANRGTIITVGKFSKGAQDAAFEQGVAPITLIDGERLIQLLIDNEIGAVYEEIKVLKFNPDDFRFEEESVEAQ